MKDKNLRNHLFGKHLMTDDPFASRTSFWRFPKAGQDDTDMEIEFNSYDGLFHYILKRLVKAEKRISELETSNTTKKSPSKP